LSIPCAKVRCRQMPSRRSRPAPAIVRADAGGLFHCWRSSARCRC
jgi:hypothetical protein